MPDLFTAIGTPAFVAADVSWGAAVSVGAGSCVGYPATVRPSAPTSIGDGVVIGAHCVIEDGAQLAARVSLDHFCRVGSGSVIGVDTRLLYGIHVFDQCHIGARCIVGGNVDDRAVLEDDVTFMGTMAHSYRHGGTVADWDTLVQPSPIIRKGAVVGQNALVLGGIEIGERSYVAAGEIVRCDVPAFQVLYRGRLSPVSAWRGILSPRRLPDATSFGEYERL